MYQDILPEIKGKGAQFVAISPELPDNSLSLKEKLKLDFEVLSDLNNDVARSFGIVFSLTEDLRGTYEKFGIDLPGTQGNKNHELPIPATFVVDGNGTIILAHIDIDYTKRLEPEDVLQVL